ncbi:MAG: alkaline phosphatase [Cyanobacteria bacterium RM1_2_2]|nr:alkaline phosphatase [Cyanobacteria bacterium RM1_2_2]
MIGDGMGWEMARAAAIYKQIREGNTGTSLSDFYTEGKGEGLSFQDLTGYSLVTTYGTTIADSKGVFSTGNSALDNSESVTAGSPVREGFNFDPSFNPGTTASGGAKVSEGATGNLVGYDPVRGGFVPWESPYYGGSREGFDKEYIKASYPDSANTATTLYTGVKSYNNAIGVDIFEQPLETILTTAALNGKSTGLVSSVPLDHATPGAAAAAVNRRAKYDGEYPGLDNILQQELRIYQPTVLLGGGHPLSNTEDPLPDGVEPPREFVFVTQDTYDYLSANPTDNRYGYTFLERGPDAAKKLAETAAQIDPNAGERLVGLYGARGQNGNLPVSSADGDHSTTGLDMFSTFSSQGEDVDTERPLLPGETDASFIATEINENPTLEQLSTAALDVLGKDEDGFWLMVEGGDIDWSAHDDNIDNLIGTMLDFDKSVASVINWIESNGGWEKNLLVVTADHDHYLTLNGDFPELVQAKGAQALTDLDTPGETGHFWGSDSSVKYGWGSHSNRPVPVYYQGAGADVLTNFVGQGYESYGNEITGFPGHVDQSQIYQTMLAAVTGSTEKPLQSGTVYGDEGNDVIYTGTEDDIVYGNGGVNYMFVNNGNNQVYGGEGDDLAYAGIDDDVFYLNGGDNTGFAGAGNDTVFANEGDDQVYGGAGDDLIYANGGNNFILAGGGNDLLYANDGDDEIDGEAGDDVIYANGGNNIITAGLGNDIVYVGSGMNTFILDAGEGSATIYGFGSDDKVSLGSGLEETATLTVLVSGNDTLISAGEDLLATLKGVQVSSVTIA